MSDSLRFPIVKNPIRTAIGKSDCNPRMDRAITIGEEMQPDRVGCTLGSVEMVGEFTANTSRATDLCGDPSRHHADDLGSACACAATEDHRAGIPGLATRMRMPSAITASRPTISRPYCSSDVKASDRD